VVILVEHTEDVLRIEPETHSIQDEVARYGVLDLLLLLPSRLEFVCVYRDHQVVLDEHLSEYSDPHAVQRRLFGSLLGLAFQFVPGEEPMYMVEGREDHVLVGFGVGRDDLHPLFERDGVVEEDDVVGEVDGNRDGALGERAGS